MKYHFIGIKGMGMAALAQIVKQQGHYVQGSDVEHELATDEALKKHNIIIKKFDEADFTDIDIVIIGHSFLDHPEAKKAKKMKKERYEYNDYLNNIISRHKKSLAISGSHGKTSTCGLTFSVLNAITPISGLIGDGSGYFADTKELFVFEACEYKRHFLMYHPDISVILNIDYDHVDYFPNLEDYILAFQEFANNTKDKVFVFNDDENIKKLSIPQDKLITFGIENESDYMAINLELHKDGYQFDFYVNKQYICHINSDKFAYYEIISLLVLLSVSHYLGYQFYQIVSNIYQYHGVKRRFEETIFLDDIYIDDYAHHPKQIVATIKKVRNKYKGYEIIAIFQPDRYSRILEFYKEIAIALLQADQAYVLDFPAMVKNDTSIEFDATIICQENSQRIKMIKQDVPCVLQKNQKYVFLLMSSKTMKPTIMKIRELRSKV